MTINCFFEGFYCLHKNISINQRGNNMKTDLKDILKKLLEFLRLNYKEILNYSLEFFKIFVMLKK